LRKKTKAEMQRARVAKVTRTIVRLKHSLAADEELNSVLPDTLAEFDEAVAAGELMELRGFLGPVLGMNDEAGA
jgi:hypothetical protein